ncbi:MAG TPA: glycosyltransferase family 39 protein [Vicinamibacterales bacterium]
MLIWIAYLLLPSEGGLLDGLPLGRIDTLGLLLLLWIAAHRIRPRGGRIAAAVGLASVIASLAVPGAPGVYARYYATAAVGGTHERSTEFRADGFTRVDRRLDFVRGRRDFPLAFFNDHARFNFTGAGQPVRSRLEFAVAWNGWLWVGPGQHTFYLDAPTQFAEVAIDATPILRATPQSGPQDVSTALTAGWHRLHVTMSSPYASSRTFSAGEIVKGRPRPFDAETTRTERIDDRQRILAMTAHLAKQVTDVAVLAWLSGLAALLLLRHAGELWQRRAGAPGAAIALYLFAAVVEGLRFAWPWAERLMVMTGGDDPMTYEAYARDILLNGPLMNGGLPLFQGEPFYYQPLYPYFLAAVHFVFGEGMFGVIFVQRVLVALTAVALMRIAMRFWGESVWPMALLVSTLFAGWKFAPIAGDLLNESLYIPLLAWWTASAIGLCLDSQPRRVLGAGLLAGLTAMARSTSVLSWPLAWIAIAIADRSRSRTRIVGVVAACSIALFSLIAVRNFLVSHRFVPVSTEFGVTLAGGNLPPEELAAVIARTQPIYERLGIDGYTAQTMAYARTAPWSFASNLGRKALFALGFYEPYAAGWGYSPVYIAVWLSAAFGIVIGWRSPFTPRVPFLLPLSIALSQYIAVVIVYPKGERLILPIYVLLLPYAVIFIHSLIRDVAPTSRSAGGSRISRSAVISYNKDDSHRAHPDHSRP